MGKWNPLNDNAIYQKLEAATNFGIFSTPAVWNNTIYYGPEYAPITAYRISNGFITTTPFSKSGTIFNARGTTPSISSNGGTNGIVWANAYDKNNYGVLHAYNASDLRQELWNTNMSGSRDQYGFATKFVPPMIANGRVFQATPTGVAVYGLLGSQKQ